jgi:RHS repeat-associated protein
MSIHCIPYGGLISSSGPLAGANTMRFSSKPAVLSATGAWGFYYYGYRFYDPGMQRWLNRDPLGEEGGFNIYLMVENNPMNGIDPQGLEKFALEKGAPQLVKLCKANTHCLQGEKVSIWICRRKLKGPEGPYPRIGPLSHSFIVCEDPMRNPHTKQKYGKQPQGSSQDGGSFVSVR